LRLFSNFFEKKSGFPALFSVKGAENSKFHVPAHDQPRDGVGGSDRVFSEQRRGNCFVTLAGVNSDNPGIWRLCDVGAQVNRIAGPCLQKETER